MLSRYGFQLAVVGGLIAACVQAQAEPVPLDRPAVVARIDDLLLAKLSQAGIEPAKISGDSEFLRRVYLDLTGQIPSVSTARDFFDDQQPNKRLRVINQLLSKPKTFRHFAEVWRKLLLPGNTSPELLQQAVGLEAWLRDKFSDELRYDRIVSDIIAATGSAAEGPALFFTALDSDPKKIAAATARIFLGLQLECAECHDHPFDDWKQEDFWGYAAFFARLPKNEGMMPARDQRLVDRQTGEVTLPDTDQVVAPQFPGGHHPSPQEPGTRRQQLAIWMGSPENPYLARAFVNRVWAQLFGLGLVEPVDDMGPHNPASHPEVIDLLADYFVASGYDFQELLRTVCQTQAYQRTSESSSQDPQPDELFAAMRVKVLTAEQLYDSLRSCLTQNEQESERQPLPFNGPQDYRRLQFVSMMSGRTSQSTVFDRGLQQALRMMNGTETTGATDRSSSPLLQSMTAPFLSDAQRIDVLYLATLTRYPTAEERLRAESFLDNEHPESAWGDLLWALINSAEFALNR